MADMTLEQVRDYLEKRKAHAFSVLDPTDAELNRRSIDAIDAVIKQREQDAKDAERYRWLAQYSNLFTVNDLLRADQYTTLTRACDALMSMAAMAKESGR